MATIPAKSRRFAIGSSDFFSFSDDDFVYTDPEAYSPLTLLAVGPSDLDLLGWSAFDAPQHRSSSGPVRCRYPAIISRKSLKEQIGVLMPRRYCGWDLNADEGHSECVSCLGKSHADAALADSDCSHCESISLASLRTRIAFFSESDPTHHALPFSSSQGPVRKKQWGRGSQHLVESELTPAQIPRASLLPHREVSPVLFSQPDQRPSASVSDLVSFGGSDDELADDSMSLVASDAEELLGSVTDPAPSGLPNSSAAGMDAELFRVLSKAVEELGLEWSPPEEPSRSRLDEWFLPGRRQAPQQRPSPFFPEVHDELTRSWRSPYSARLRTSASSALTYGWRRWRKGIWEDASTGWVSGCTSLPTHCHRLEGEGQSPVQAMQDHFSARWTLLRFSWAGGFGAPLYGGSSGLSGQAPLCRRWVWAWSCDSQGAEKRNGPGFASHQDYRPSHRKVYGQPGSARAPPVAHADGDQGRGQGLLPWCSNFPQRPLWTCGGRIRWALHRSTEGVTGYATLPAQALQPSSCSESPQDCADSAACETCTCRFRPSAC